MIMFPVVPNCEPLFVIVYIVVSHMVSSLLLAARPDTNNLSAEPNLITANMGSNIGVFAFSDVVMYINWLHVDIHIYDGLVSVAEIRVVRH